MTRTIADYPQVTQGEVRDTFDFHAESGLLFRTSKDGLKRTAGTTTASGEVRIYWHRTYWPAQLLVWIHQIGTPAAVPVHRDKDKGNNNLTNLRMPWTLASEKAELDRLALPRTDTSYRAGHRAHENWARNVMVANAVVAEQTGRGITLSEEGEALMTELAPIVENSALHKIMQKLGDKARRGE